MTANVIVWIVLAGTFLIVEALTVGLVSIWFAIGSLFAIIPAFFGAGIAVQVLTFALCSALSFALLFKTVRKLMQVNKTATNADRIIGGSGTVIITVNPADGTGQIKASGGEVWSAKTIDGSVIEKGEKVTILRIEGVKAVVEREV